MAKRGPDLIDPRLIKATEHPLRIEILNVLREGPSSPARIQRQLENVSLNLVSHHMKVLKDLGCVEGRSEVVDLLNVTLAEILKIGERSLQLTETSDETPAPTTVVIMQFPTVERKPQEGLLG